MYWQCSGEYLAVKVLSLFHFSSTWVEWWKSMFLLSPDRELWGAGWRLLKFHMILCCGVQVDHELHQKQRKVRTQYLSFSEWKSMTFKLRLLSWRTRMTRLLCLHGNSRAIKSTIRGKQANYAFYRSPICLLLCPGRTKKHMRGSSTYTMLMSWRQWPQQSISWLQRWTGTAVLSSPSKLGAAITKLIWTLYFSFLM